MNKVFRYLVDLNYSNVLMLTFLSLITMFLQPIIPIAKYISAFLVSIMIILALLSPVLRFKSIIFGRSRILFLTPKPYGYIIRGYIFSEIIIFITFFIGIIAGLYSLEGQVSLFGYLLNKGIVNQPLPYYSIWLFIKMADIWFSFLTTGILSVVFSKVYFDRVRFVSIKIFIAFVAIQFLNILIVEILCVLMIETLIRLIISIYTLSLAYRKIKNIDIY
ncbi:MAG: hypothetical protein RR515_03955 [Clostridium sp.]